MIKRLPMHEKPPIWELFFAYQNLWSQHFLHGITTVKYGLFYVINCKFINKNNLLSHVDIQYRQIPSVIRIFSTHRKSEKKLPYGKKFYRFPISAQNNFFCLFSVPRGENWLYNEKEWFLCHHFDCKKRGQSYLVLC